MSYILDRYVGYFSINWYYSFGFYLAILEMLVSQVKWLVVKRSWTWRLGFAWISPLLSSWEREGCELVFLFLFFFFFLFYPPTAKWTMMRPEGLRVLYFPDVAHIDWFRLIVYLLNSRIGWIAYIFCVSALIKWIMLRCARGASRWSCCSETVIWLTWMTDWVIEYFIHSLQIVHFSQINAIQLVILLQLCVFVIVFL